MLHWSTEGLDNETRWMPFPRSFQEWEQQTNAYDLPTTDIISPHAWDLAPEQFVARMEQGETFEWMRGKTIIVFVGTSLVLWALQADSQALGMFRQYCVRTQTDTTALTHLMKPLCQHCSREYLERFN